MVAGEVEVIGHSQGDQPSGGGKGAGHFMECFSVPNAPVSLQVAPWQSLCGKADYSSGT